jgi:TonB family protein
MATPTIDAPKTNPPGDGPALYRRPASSREPEELHLLIADLTDEQSRSRMREALWISIILHLIFIFSVHQFPKLFPEKSVALLTPEQVLQDKNHELTYIEQPHDNQRVTQKPNTSKISDKDRIASTKNPQIDRRTLERLASNRREGAPGQLTSPQSAPPQPQAQQQPAQQMMANATPPNQQQEQTNPNARLTEPQSQSQRKPNIFGGASGPSTAVDQAVREAARARGMGGQYGGGPGIVGNAARSDMEILTDTMGVDFSSYLQRLRIAIQLHWEPLIPEVARAPLSKQGMVRIEFVISKDGKVEGMRLDGPSGDVSLDRAAWGAIVGSNPFPPLPKEFSGPVFALRVSFYYNPSDAANLR